MLFKTMSLATLLVTIIGIQTVPAAAADSPPGKYRVYVGSYTTHGTKEGKGISTFDFDLATGKATAPRLVATIDNPSFLAIAPDGKHLYAAIEVSALGKEPEDQNTGGVAAFTIDPSSGNLTKLNVTPAHGTITCHVSMDQSGKYVLAANYGKRATAATFPVNKDGSLGKAITTVTHVGKSANSGRQESPHGHSINLTPDGKFAIVADLGIDCLQVYPFDESTGKLDVEHPFTAMTKEGAGPRHFAFHPNGKFGYQNNELDWTVTAYQYDAEHGHLLALQTLTTIPEDFKGSGGTAEVAVHPHGKLLYVSNRGPDSLAIYHILDDGTLKPAGFASTQGKIPRNFLIEPTGKYLFAANQDSDTVVVFTIDPETGALTPTGEVIKIPMPVCVRLMPLK